MASLVNATIRTRSFGADEIVLANNLSFTANLRRIPLDDPSKVVCFGEADPSDATFLWWVCDIPGWDLTIDADPSEGGFYSVFVKFIDENGYESEAQIASVALQGAAPTGE
jgi:hypothetical protein